MSQDPSQVKRDFFGCKGKIDKRIFEPICWLIEQFDFSNQEVFRRIVWKKPPEGLGAEVKEIHAVSINSEKQKILTDDEIHACFQQKHKDKATERRMIVRAIERAHGIGGAA